MNQQYIEWLPGTVARVSSQMSNSPDQQHLSGEVNKLSLVVVKFNEWLRHNTGLWYSSKLEKLNQIFQTL